MKLVIKATIIVNNTIIEDYLQYVPTKDEIIEINGVEHIVKDVKTNIKSIHNDVQTHYCTIVCEKFIRDMVHIPQYEFIQGNDYEDMKNNLNKFLYENRIKYAILEITHAGAYIAIQYQLRSKKEMFSAQMNELYYNPK